MGNMLLPRWVSPTVPKKDGTTLVEITVGHINLAHKIVGMQPEEFTPLVLVPLVDRDLQFCCPCGPVAVPEGFHAIVSRFGGDVPFSDKEEAWPSGFHCFWPGYKVSRLVTRQKIIYDTPVNAVKTADSIPVRIDVLMVLEITKPQTFVYRLGPEKLDDLLRAWQDEVVRSVASEIPIESIYDLHDSGLDERVTKMNEKLEYYGVECQHFTVRRVVIPSDMAQDFEEKTLYESRTKEKQMQQEFDWQKLSSEEEQQKLKEECDNARMAAEEEAVTSKAQITKETQETIALSSKDISLVEAQRKADVADVSCHGDLEAAKLVAERERIVKDAAASVEQAVGILEAKATQYAQDKTSKAMVEASEKVNEGRKALVEAEGESTEAFTARRAQEQELQRLAILERLTSNRSTKLVTSMENNSGLAPGNSLIDQIAGQGMEAFRMKLAEVTQASATKLLMDPIVQGGLIRPAPLQQTMT